MQPSQLSSLLQQRLFASSEYRPLILSPQLPADFSLLLQLLANPQTLVLDTLASQLGELIKIRHLQQRFSPAALAAAVTEYLGQSEPAVYGVWVYYPWSRRLVHTLAEAEFCEVRTNRNHYKITPAEQQQLRGKRIGVIGLSVGHAVALTLATERTCGELRLADFDHLELTNLNRVRSGIHHLGVAKVVAAAREIAEIDPFLQVTCLREGVTAANLDGFLTEGGALDVLVEECDSLDIKLLARQRAKHYRIPVLMSTSDRGMIDVERFDRQPERSLLHGLLDHLDVSQLQDLTTEAKVPYILAMLGMETMSVRGKASMLEVEQSIATWPQLATAVMLGGAVVGDVARRIVLDQFHASGRYCVDPEALIQDQAAIGRTVAEEPLQGEATVADSPPTLTAQEMRASAHQTMLPPIANPLPLSQPQVRQLVTAATLAPSGGNVQPWRWLYQAGNLYLFHAPTAATLLDFTDSGAYLALGAALENLVLQAHAMSLDVYVQSYVAPQQRLVAAVRFAHSDPAAVRGDPMAGLEPHLCDDLAAMIPLRLTNRQLGEHQASAPACLHALQQIGQSAPGAQITWLTGAEELAALASIAGAVERLRLLNRQGHHDFVHEMRWTPAEAETRRDGVDLATMDLTQAEQAGLTVAKSWPVVEAVKGWHGGSVFAKPMHKAVAAASCIGLLTMPRYSLADCFAGGRALQRLWLAATQAGLALQPLASTTFLFARLRHGQGVGLEEEAIAELQRLRPRFVNLFPIVAQGQEAILLFRLAQAAAPTVRAYRYPVSHVLTIVAEETNDETSSPH